MNIHFIHISSNNTYDTSKEMVTKLEAGNRRLKLNTQFSIRNIFQRKYIIFGVIRKKSAPCENNETILINL